MRFLGPQDTLNYLTTYLADRPKYLGYLKKNSHWVSAVRALWCAVWYYCIRINWKNIGKTSWESMRIINKKPEDPGFVCFIDVCNKSTYSMLGCGWLKLWNCIDTKYVSRAKIFTPKMGHQGAICWLRKELFCFSSHFFGNKTLFVKIGSWNV